MKKEEKNKEEVLEYCVVPRNVAVENIKRIMSEHKDVFDEFNMWNKILNSPVTITSEEESK